MAKRKFKPNLKQLSLLVFLLFTFSWSAYKILVTQNVVKNLNNELRKISDAIVDIREQQKAVEAEIARWNDPSVIEGIARKELGLVKPGEITYMFSEPVQPATDTEVTKRNSSSKEGIGN